MIDKPRQWEGFSFWPSFTDVMVVTLLVFLFFLFAQMTFSSEALRAGRMVRHQKSIAEEINAALGDEQRVLTIVSDGNLQRFQFSDQILFDRGEADLLPRGQEVLRKVGEVLLRRAEYYRTAQVEGHTDVRPIKTPRFPSNWELSSARATSVVRFLQDDVGFNPTILSATGYAEFRPVDATDGEEAFARNRRVELVLVYSVKNEARRPDKERQLADASPLQVVATMP